MKGALVFITVFVYSSVNAFDDKVVNTLKDVRSSGRMTDQCNDALALYFDNLNSTTDRWALRMLDATSKVPVGLLFKLNNGELGEFDECLDTESEDGLIQPKYCLGYINLNSLIGSQTDTTVLQRQAHLREVIRGVANIDTQAGGGGGWGGPTWAICLPRDCTDRDVGEVMQQLIGTPFARCQTKDDQSPPLTNGAIATIVILALIFAVMVESTLCDLYYIYIGKAPPHEILVAFSIYKNGKKIFKTSKNSAELSCLNGIKLLSMSWVVIGHLFASYGGTIPVSNYQDMLDWAETVGSMILISSTLSVDSFFLMGGLLVVYGFMKAKHNGVKFNIFYFYLHRYLRLTPALAAVVLISANLLHYMGTGPNWSSINGFETPCQKHWWSTLLYVQNYANVDQMCLVQTWYLSVDMQLYVFSPLILIPLGRYPKLGVSLIVALIGVFIIIPSYLAYDLELTGILSNFNSRGGQMNYWNKYYYLTHARAAPWVIGALLGYVLANIKFSPERNQRLIKIGKPVSLILWAACIAVTFTCIYAGHSTLRGVEYDKWGNTLYIGLVRSAWAISLSWVILACVLGYGGPINVLLSVPIYQVLNRFTYSIYLIHLTLISVIFNHARRSSYFSMLDVSYSFWGLTMFSFGLSIISVLAFESPMIYIEKLIFKGIHVVVSKIPIRAGSKQKHQNGSAQNHQKGELSA